MLLGRFCLLIERPRPDQSTALRFRGRSGSPPGQFRGQRLHPDEPARRSDITRSPPSGSPVGCRQLACDQERGHVVKVGSVPLRPFLVRPGLSFPHYLSRLAFRLDIPHGRTYDPTHPPDQHRSQLLPHQFSSSPSPISLPTSNSHSTLLPRRPYPATLPQHHHSPASQPACLVHLKIARMPRACWGSPSTSGRSQRRLFRFTSQFRRPQHLGASSGCSAQSRVPRAGLYRPHRSSGRMAGACRVRGTRWRSCGEGGAFMAGVSSFGCGRTWLVVELERGRDEQAATRRGAPFQPALEHARIRPHPAGP
jgi:hypothetical protein